MEIIGLIAEYNPFHNGHLYQIKKIKEMYPDSIIVLALNGYFLERGEISIETKEEKTRLAINNGVDIVVELPFIFGSQASDIFASKAIDILNKFNITKLVFGSESNDIKLLTEIANYQNNIEFNNKVKEYLNEGLNYPTALNKAGLKNIDTPNDLLGISYIKAILNNNYNIEPVTIKRTNDYHDTYLDSDIVSASNIREKIKNNIDIKKYIPEGNIVSINENKLFELLKYKVLTDQNLDEYLTVDEGIDNRIKKCINDASSIDELIKLIKTKRYTYNKIKRMLIHILVGIKKKDIPNEIEYIKILGINNLGQSYLKNLELPLFNKHNSINTITYKYELIVSKLYDSLTNQNTINFELSNKPIKKDN